MRGRGACIGSGHCLALLLLAAAALPAWAAPSLEPPVPATAPAPRDSERDRPVALDRPNWGKVIGWVLDAATRKPVPDARVSVELNGAFPERGKATDRTDAGGRFEAKAPLGKISSKFDWGRLLTMHPVSLLLSPRSVTKQTRVLEVTRVNVRVEADGYEPFVGRVQARRLNATDFSITLDDVWLAPDASPLTSFTPERLRQEIIERFAVEPEIAAPGETVTISLKTRLPVERGFRYKAYVTSSAIRLVKDELELKREKPGEDADQVVFSRAVKLPRASVDRWTELGFVLVRDGAELRQKETRALLQIATERELPAAKKVAEGYAKALAGDREGGLRDYSQARKVGPDYPLAHLRAGDLAIEMSRPAEAVDPYRQLVRLEPDDYQVARPRCALALYESGNVPDAMRQLVGAEEIVGKKKLPAEVELLRARIFAYQGNFAEADKWLAKAGADATLPEDIVTEINLRRLTAALKSSPKSSELRLSYARVLSDQRRREEALVQIRKAIELDPSDGWAFLDLGNLLWKLGEKSDGLANLKHALALAPTNLEAMMALADVYRESGRYAEALPLYQQVAARQSLNLRARHYQAIMLYAAGRLAETEREFVEVIAQARDKGDLKESGLMIPGAAIYIGPKRRLVYGFSVPEATADMEILEALQDLRRHPDNGLLWQNIGGALLELKLPDLALQALAKSRKQEPSLLETRFLMGEAYRRLGKTAEAQAELEAVIAANPLHPRARLELAQLLIDRGEIDGAQAQLLAHGKNYPYERVQRTAQAFGG